MLPNQGLCPPIDEALRQVLKDLPTGRFREAGYVDLDVTGEPEATGKLQGQDRRLGRRIFVTLLGVDAAATLAQEFLAVAKASANLPGVRAGPLIC